MFVVGGMVLVLGCSSSRPARTSPPPAASPSTTQAQAPSTTAAIALIPQGSPDTAATTLLTAWRAGDPTLAAKVAIPAVIAAVFGRPAQAFSDRGCQDPVGGQSSCAFAVGGGLVSVHTVTLAGGWVVDQIAFE